MPIRVLIIENDPIFCLTLERMFFELGGYELVAILKTAEEAEAELQTNKVDIIICDIFLDGEKTGFDFSEKNQQFNSTPIIFITEWQTEEVYAQIQNQHYHHLLVKPFHKYTLDSTIKVLLNTKSSSLETKNNNLLYIKIGAKHEIIDPLTICWIESNLNYCTIFTTARQYTVKRALKGLVEDLPKEHFVQIHQSFCVRIDLIKRIDLKEQKVVLENKKLPLGRTFLKNLQKRFHQLG